MAARGHRVFRGLLMDTEQLSRFFNELSPRLDMAREVDDRLNSELAYRFNVLDYIRTSELGLSRVIADLLDPSATHGQKTLFLNTFLRGLQCASEQRGRPLDITRDYGHKWEVVGDTRVQVERTIPPGRRRLDISVEFKGSDGRLRCLAIENKPYAGDQKNQIRDYLDFMEKEYGRKDGHQPTNHLLIYLSRTGELPSEWSVEKERLAREIEEYDFAVMGYSMEGAAASGKDDDSSSESRLLVDYSLAKWFAACRKECDVERLRNFLRDAEAFCKQHFGGAAMPDRTQDQIRQFLEDPHNMKIAIEVHRNWPEVRAGIKRRFAGRLVERIRARLRDDRQLRDLQCEHRVTGHDGDRWQEVSVFRHGDAWRVKGHQVSIKMQAQRQGTEAWIIGIATGDQLAEVRDALSASLSKDLGTAKTSTHWPWYEWIPDRWGWWNRNVADLAREQAEDGEATRYFVERVAHLCAAAVPIIDETILKYKDDRP